MSQLFLIKDSAISAGMLEKVMPMMIWEGVFGEGGLVIAYQLSDRFKRSTA